MSAGQTATWTGTKLPKMSCIEASTSAFATGFAFGYLQRQHVGATSWSVMTALDFTRTHKNSWRPTATVCRVTIIEDAPSPTRRWRGIVLWWLLVLPGLLWAVVRLGGWERGVLVQLFAFTPYVAAWSVPLALAALLAVWTVPLAFTVKVAGSLLTGGRVPADVGATMLAAVRPGSRVKEA